MLRERVTLTKILSVALTVVGVCLVSLYPSNSLDDEEERTNTTMPGLSANDDDDEEYENPLGYAVSSLILCLHIATGSAFLFLSVCHHQCFALRYLPNILQTPSFSRR